MNILKEVRSRRKYYEKLHEANREDEYSYLYTQRNLSKPIVDTLEKLKRKRILEIGCGGGHLSNYVQKNGNKVVSIDISSVSLHAGKNNYSNLNLIQMDAENLAFVDNYFDVVISIELIEHLPNLQKHFEEVKRTLNDNGIYLFKTPNKWPHNFYWKFLRQKDVSEEHPSVCDIKSLRWELYRNGLSVQFYKQSRLTEAQIVKMEKILPKNLSRAISKLINIIICLIPLSLMPSIICSAKKIKEY